MKEIILTWEDLVNRYDDDQQSFEEYFCYEIGISYSDAEDFHLQLDKRYGKSKFAVRPNYDYIRWKGVVNSDFRVSLIG